MEDNDRSPIWVPNTQHVFTAKEMGYGKTKESNYRSKKIAAGFTAAIGKFNGGNGCYFRPGFAVAGGTTGYQWKFFRINSQTPFMKAYLEAVDYYVFIHALSREERDRLYQKCPPKDIFYLDYKRRYDKGEDISIIEILDSLDMNDFNLNNIKV
ncbi:hypothetical protein JL830_25750 [Vibrio parahaemolyticus]|uniref:hypothetical protein n=1 Tax=Vibrio parahaemolyticus TaxID=670 RepID=UPI0018835734|nr:hypothetical protein [Vibrio parahaemolyticus]MCI9702262.1 hypothetical protein [Vibrio parahaemolyticus]MDF4316409.1 hypothetical protein [Vibrio parahaemolyticus]MDF5088038.1 hypothetical protein [Vibrio parahaemolyticus]MDF5408756.1 hypothetical protein [Vibrio parahaemolyticus]MDG2824189.1 hypothetical protein [Vibrio parahaemolyticus]